MYERQVRYFFTDTFGTSLCGHSRDLDPCVFGQIDDISDPNRPATITSACSLVSPITSLLGPVRKLLLDRDQVWSQAVKY